MFREYYSLNPGTGDRFRGPPPCSQPFTASGLQMYGIIVMKWRGEQRCIPFYGKSAL